MEMNALYICRLCSWSLPPLLPLLASSELASMIRAVLPVKVESNDPYPKYICRPCVYKVHVIHDFFFLCQRNEKRLKRWYHLIHRPGNRNDTIAEATERDPIAVDVPEEPCTSSSLLLPQTPPIVSTTENVIDQNVDQSQILFARLNSKSMLQNGEEVVENKLSDTDTAAIADTSRNIDQHKGTSVTSAEMRDSFCEMEDNPDGRKRKRRAGFSLGSLKVCCEICNRDFNSKAAFGLHKFKSKIHKRLTLKLALKKKCSNVGRETDGETGLIYTYSKTNESPKMRDALCEIDSENNESAEVSDALRETEDTRKRKRLSSFSGSSLEVCCDVCKKYFKTKAAFTLHNKSKAHKTTLKLGLKEKMSNWQP